MTTLGEERTLMEDYLKFENFRFLDQLQIDWSWDESLNGLKVVPLLFQSMIENAMKHGISPNGGGILYITTERGDTEVRLAVKNALPPESLRRAKSKHAKSTGTGIKNLESRLQLAYKDKARFRLQVDSEWATAEIRIQNSALKLTNACLNPELIPTPRPA